MDETELGAIWKKYWALRLFDSVPGIRLLPWPVGAAVYAVALYLAGLLLFWILGDADIYIFSPLPYLQASAMWFGLAAHVSSAKRVPRTLSSLSLALREDPEVLTNSFRKWTESWLLRPSGALLFALLFVLLYAGHASYAHVLQTRGTILRIWVGSPSRNYYLAWYVIAQGGIMGFLLGAGLAGAIAWFRLISGLLRSTLRLAYHRFLKAPVHHSEGLAMWSLFALVSAVFFTDPNAMMALFGNGSETANLPYSLGVPITGILVGLIALGLLCSLIVVPLLTIRASLEREKGLHIPKLRQALEQVFGELREIQLHSPPDAQPHQQYLTDLARGGLGKRQAEQLERLANRARRIRHLLAELDEIPSWQLGFARTLRILISAAVVGIIPELLSILT